MGVADAQSVNGYTGFGAGGNGPTKSPALLTAPGAWRLAAQVATPTQWAWSDWVEVTVTPPLPVSAKSVPKAFIK